jgi:hypothetical protein
MVQVVASCGIRAPLLWTVGHVLNHGMSQALLASACCLLILTVLLALVLLQCREPGEVRAERNSHPAHQAKKKCHIPMSVLPAPQAFFARPLPGDHPVRVRAVVDA